MLSKRLWKNNHLFKTAIFRREKYSARNRSTRRSRDYFWRKLYRFSAFFSAIFVFFIPEGLVAQPGFTFEREEPPTMEMLIGAQEEFEYEVRYGPFTLGWVEVKLLPDSTVDGKIAHHIRTVMRSNSRVPFVSSSEVHYESLFRYNEDWPYGLVFWRNDIHDDEYDRLRVEFNRELGDVIFFERGEVTDTLDLVEPASGGDIIFYYSRLFAGSEEPYTLPVYTENERGDVTSKSSPQTEMREYKAFDEPVETYLSEGKADIEGPFGFNGNFKSWFLTDDLRVPVEAHVRVMFGNVKIRLISYQRNGTN